jgi:uncharacterized repeat protein (TIGR04076 family)
MAIEYPSLGHKVVAKVMDMQNPCTIGMQKGDEFEVSMHRCGEFCGAFYHNIHSWISVMQCNGALPLLTDPEVMELQCPNNASQVKIELRRISD